MQIKRTLTFIEKIAAGIGRTICSLAISMLAPHKAQSYGKAAIRQARSKASTG